MNENLELIKQAVAALKCDWPTMVKLVEAVQAIEKDLKELEQWRVPKISSTIVTQTTKAT